MGLEPPHLSDEMYQVHKRRYLEARAAGLTIVESKLFADSERDVGQLRSLVASHCPTGLLAKIVL